MLSAFIKEALQGNNSHTLTRKSSALLESAHMR